MNREEELRFRRNYVSQMYPYPGWHEKVARMSDDRVTAIYLRFVRDDQKPKPETPEKLEQDLKDDPPPEQLGLF